MGMAKFTQVDVDHVEVAYLHAYAHRICARAQDQYAVHKVPRSAAQAGILKPPLSHVCMRTIDGEPAVDRWTESLWTLL